MPRMPTHTETISVEHVLLRCACTLKARQKTVLRLARKIEGIGLPGATTGQTDPSMSFKDEGKFQRHLISQPNHKVTVTDHNGGRTNIHAGIRRVQFRDPENINKRVIMRADIYWRLWKTIDKNIVNLNDMESVIAIKFKQTLNT